MPALGPASELVIKTGKVGADGMRDVTVGCVYNFLTELDNKCKDHAGGDIPCPVIETSSHTNPLDRPLSISMHQ